MLKFFYLFMFAAALACAFLLRHDGPGSGLGWGVALFTGLGGGVALYNTLRYGSPLRDYKRRP